jgi:2-C-methyl-D-erythritol 2,4-cyclodiphosphate synthase
VVSGLRIGFGEDAHRLVSGRPLLIGGIEIPSSPRGADAVSDGDALLHAFADALLSSFSEGDIGDFFPTHDPISTGLPSAALLTAVLQHILTNHGSFVIRNLAATVTIDKPKLGPFRSAISKRIAFLTGLEPSQIGITFKTSEGLTPDHVQARATVLVETLTQP